MNQNILMKELKQMLKPYSKEYFNVNYAQVKSLSLSLHRLFM